METEMEPTSETADNETANDPEAAKSHEFRVNVSAIESVAKDQQASELQSLELEVFDHATLEKGIIAQVNEAIEAAEPSKVQSTKAAAFEDGEIQDVVGPEDDEEEDDFSRRIRLGEVTPFEQSKEGKSFQEKAKNGYNEILERYMASQAGMENARRKMVNRHPSNKQPPAKLSPNKRQKKPKEFVPEVEEQKAAKEKTKRDLKSKFVGAKTRKKAIKEKLGTRRERGAARCDTAAQPGEENVMNVNNTSGSEYLPSESDDSGVHPSKARKRVFKPLKSMMTKITTRDDSESDWESSDEELTKKRRGNKELDDGDPHYFTKRLKVINQYDYLKEAHFVMDEFKCPKIVWDKLYKYQQVAVKWFWELNQQRCGGILGDEMGLGKTIQVIAFLSGLYVSDIYDYDTGFKGLGPTLVVCPTTVMHQWVREFHAWFPILRVAILHESGTFSNTGKERTRLIDSIHSHDYGVLITSYTGLVKHSKKMLEKQWHYVILDEGHKIRNNQAQVTVVAKQLETPHRIILSGSPLQNNLKELWSLFDFIFPGKLGTLQVFTNVFHLPIVAGGYTNASPSQVMQAYKCAVTLKDTITPYLLRRMKCDVDAHIKLPPKTEQVLFCNLTNEQKDLYKSYLKDVNIEDMVKGDAKVFVGLINLRKICNHPDLYSGGPSSDFTIRGSSEAPDEDRFGHWERAGKMIVVRTLLKIWHQQKHRVLLFTQTQKMLIILEDFVKRCSYNYLKLDGNTSVAARQPLIDKFNKDTSHFIMLLTTKVGGLGVNLTGANRVVIYDPDWNPATDTQARERAWRIGQERDVTVYRLITAGTIEEKIYHRQIFKQFLSNKVLKDPKQRRFFKSNDLSELFTFSETVKNGTNETAAIFAGTGSEVKLSKMTAKKKARFSAKEAAQDPKITFSESKIEGMKRIAHMLSQKMMIKVSALNCKESAASTSQNVDSIQNSKGSVLVTDVYGPDGKLISENVQKLNEDSSGRIGEDMRSQLDKNEPENSSGTKLLTDENDNHAKIASKKRSAPSEEVGPRRRKKKKRDKKEKGKFEGHVVPHLVRCKSVKNNRNEELQAAATQDDYVLSKLFSKTGIETALRHDTIMEGGPHDYAIIEAEADRVAHEAIKALKESSAQVPVVRKPLLKPTAQGSALLNAIRKRNMVVDASDSENQLVRNLVSYLSSNGGVASTDKIIAEFSSKVDPNKSPVFKSLLGKIATFHRGSDKIGYWTLKDEFKLQLDS